MCRDVIALISLFNLLCRRASGLFDCLALSGGMDAAIKYHGDRHRCAPKDSLYPISRHCSAAIARVFQRNFALVVRGYICV
jgi:hypothetical protein